MRDADILSTQSFKSLIWCWIAIVGGVHFNSGHGFSFKAALIIKTDQLHIDKIYIISFLCMLVGLCMDM